MFHENNYMKFIFIMIFWSISVEMRILFMIKFKIYDHPPKLQLECAFDMNPFLRSVFNSCEVHDTRKECLILFFINKFLLFKKLMYIPSLPLNCLYWGCGHGTHSNILIIYSLINYFETVVIKLQLSKLQLSKLLYKIEKIQKKVIKLQFICVLKCVLNERDKGSNIF